MARFTSAMLPIFLASSLTAGVAEARHRLPQDTSSLAPIAEGSPTLAPFQHVRFCLRYPSDCKSDPTGNERIDLSTENAELLNRINRDVNAQINPIVKNYGRDLQDGWTIAPAMGDCNDYAVRSATRCFRAVCPPGRCDFRWSRPQRESAISFWSS